MISRDSNPPTPTHAVIVPMPTTGQDVTSVDDCVAKLSSELTDGGADVVVVLLDARELPTGLDPEAQCERLRLDDTPPIHVPAHRVASYRLYAWLKDRTFDEVHVPEVSGAGFYALVAKMQGLWFDETKFVVHACGPTAFNSESAGRFVEDIDALELDFMERECVRLADAFECDSGPLAKWMEANGFEHAPVPAPSASACESRALVSVCVTVHDRHEFLSQAIQSIERQDYPHVELVLVDDGSTSPSLWTLIDELRPRFETRGWKIVRQENRYLGAARNEAVRHARGDYVLFVDDDDVLRPELVSTLVPVAERTGADVLSTFVDFFSSAEAPAGSDVPEGRWIPLGGAVEAGAFRNVFGSATSLIRKRMLVDLGGFSEDFGVGCEDWELYARAALGGRNLQVVPEFLFWYRKLPGSMLETTPLHRNRTRVLRPYRSSARVGGSILDFAVGSALANESRSSRLADMERRLETTQTELGAAERKIDDLASINERLRRQESSDVDAVLECARLLAGLGERDAALTTLRALGGLVDRLRDPVVTALAKSEGGALFAILDDDDAAIVWTDHAVSASGSVDDPALVARTLGRCGETLDGIADDRGGARSEACFDRAFEISGEILDPVTVELRLSMGKRHLRRGNTLSAWRCLWEAHELARERGYGKLLAQSLLAMAPLASSFGEPGRDDGAAMVVEAIGIARETKSARLLIHVMTESAAVLEALGRPEFASVLASATTLAKQTGNALAAVKLGSHASESEPFKETLA